MRKFYIYLFIVQRSTEPFKEINQDFPKPKLQRLFWIEVNDKKMAISEGLVFLT